MLNLVVLNERRDLQETFSNTTKDIFENIKSLKDIENAILNQLNEKVEDLLDNEQLIKILNESKNTAEYIASKLKIINQTNQFIQKSRVTYTPVAYRAAILYFVVADQHKVNNMY
jgi:dynein heavy chain